MNTEHQYLTRIIALMGAFIMFAIGAVMMWQGISAEGTIDIKSSILSGSIQTGSAGLFISFLSFFIIAMVLLLTGVNKKETENEVQQRHKRAMPIFWALLICFVTSTTLAVSGYGAGFGIAAGALGFLLFMSVVAILTYIESE